MTPNTHSLRRDVVRVRVVRICKVLILDTMIENSITLPVQASHPRRFLVTISLHISVIIVLVSPRFSSLLLPTLFASLPSLLAHISFAPMSNDTSSTKPCRLRCSTQRGTIRSFPSQDGRFVIIPIALPEVKTAVLGPEEKPDAGEHEGYAYESEKSEKGMVVDVVGVNGASTGVVSWILVWFRNVPGF